jgi:hypothetical protein
MADSVLVTKQFRQDAVEIMKWLASCDDDDGVMGSIVKYFSRIKKSVDEKEEWYEHIDGIIERVKDYAKQ